MSKSATGPKADEEWEELLREWRAQPEAGPRPYFYGRVRARLLNAATATASRPPVHTWLRWPAYAVMLGMLLLLSGDEVALQAANAAPPESSRGPETRSGPD